MTLRTKLGLMFFGAVQVTFLTAAAAFWAVESWQLLTDDLTLIHAQSRRLDDILGNGTAGSAAGAGDGLGITPNARAAFDELQDSVQTAQEGDLVAALGAALAPPPGIVPSVDGARQAAARLKAYYDDNVQALRTRARFVTRLSTGLFIAIVVLVLGGMMAYFAAIRVWLVRPIQTLSHATGVISTGNLEHRIRVSGRDELGRLAASINSMAGSLATQQRQLLQAERFAMIGEMSAYVAHNIRNPVASIRATAQSELDHMPDGDTRREVFLDVVRAADRIVSWVGDLLRYSTPVSLEKSAADLGSMLQDSVDMLRPALAAKRVQVHFEPVPPPPPVAVDHNKMEQVFGAVLGNALEASPNDASIDVTLTRRERPDGGVRAEIRIADRGSGIPESRLRTLFTPFATTKKSGTGLGLSMAHKIVSAHNGTVTVSNREGGGTLVEISLPAGDGA